MHEQLKISYETMGASSYMTMVCPAEVELIHYQMETLLSNEIKNLLGVSRQLVDGETVIYYNITSRIPLSQVLEKRKLKRKELLNLVEGLILAVQDASAYRLPEEGIVLEPEYIYVNPASCKPSFLYIPVEQKKEWEIKDLIAGLIMHDQIELSNDNLVQVLLKELNSQPFSLERLGQNLKTYQNERTGENRAAQVKVPTEVSHPVETVSSLLENRPTISDRTQDRNVNLQPEIQSSFLQQEKSSPKTKPDAPALPEDKKKRKKEKPEKKKAVQKKADDHEEKGAGAGKAKKMFLLPQVVILLLICAGISFGLFVDETGKIALNTILAFVVLIAVAEIVLYREIFINKKETKPQKAKKVPSEKPSLPGKASKPVPPKKSELLQNPEPEQHTAQHSSIQDFAPQQNYAPQPEIVPQPIPMPVHDIYLDDSDTDIGSETELWDGSEDIPDAYLEYGTGGNLHKIPISGPNGIIIGRLESQVDFAVKNPKVGKVHAKFFGQNNQYFVVDINSKNGTYINGNRTRIESNSPYRLHDKDRITLADSEFVIRCAEN